MQFPPISDVFIYHMEVVRAVFSLHYEWLGDDAAGTVSGEMPVGSFGPDSISDRLIKSLPDGLVTTQEPLPAKP